MLFITDINQLNFKNKKICIYFYKPHMLVHKMIMYILEKAEIKFNKIKFYAIDINSFPEFIVRYELFTLPTIILFKNNGYIYKRIDGFDKIMLNKDKLFKWLGYINYE